MTVIQEVTLSTVQIAAWIYVFWCLIRQERLVNRLKSQNEQLLKAIRFFEKVRMMLGSSMLDEKLWGPIKKDDIQKIIDDWTKDMDAVFEGLKEKGGDKVARLRKFGAKQRRRK